MSGDQAEPRAVLQHCKSSAHERNRSRVHTRDVLTVGGGAMYEAAVDFELARRLLNISGSEGCQQIPHEDHPLTASLSAALLHEKHSRSARVCRTSAPKPLGAY